MENLVLNHCMYNILGVVFNHVAIIAHDGTEEEEVLFFCKLSTTVNNYEDKLIYNINFSQKVCDLRISVETS